MVHLVALSCVCFFFFLNKGNRNIYQLRTKKNLNSPIKGLVDLSWRGIPSAGVWAQAPMTAFHDREDQSPVLDEGRGVLCKGKCPFQTEHPSHREQPLDPSPAPLTPAILPNSLCLQGSSSLKAVGSYGRHRIFAASQPRFPSAVTTVQMGAFETRHSTRPSASGSASVKAYDTSLPVSRVR